MTTKELYAYFREHLVPGKLYNLKGGRRGRICLERVKDGWNVYFRDRKEKVGLMHFASESDACRYMQDEIRKVMEGLYGLTWVRPNT